MAPKVYIFFWKIPVKLQFDPKFFSVGCPEKEAESAAAANNNVTNYTTN